MSIEEVLLARTGLNGEPSKDLRIDFAIYGGTFTVLDGYMEERAEVAMKLVEQEKDVLFFPSEESVYYECRDCPGDLESLAGAPLTVSYCVQKPGEDICRCSKLGETLERIQNQLEGWSWSCGVNLWPMSGAMDYKQYDQFARAIIPYEAALQKLKSILPTDRFQLVAYGNFLGRQDRRRVSLEELTTETTDILREAAQSVDHTFCQKKMREFIDQRRGAYD